MPTNKTLGKDKVKQQDELIDQKKKNKENKPLSEADIDTDSPTPGSMSEGNLSNNEYGRERRQTPHRKTFITGSDDDGQAV